MAAIAVRPIPIEAIEMGATVAAEIALRRAGMENASEFLPAPTLLWPQPPGD